jgi:hypothetical protein
MQWAKIKFKDLTAFLTPKMMMVMGAAYFVTSFFPGQFDLENFLVITHSFDCTVDCGKPKCV